MGSAVSAVGGGVEVGEETIDVMDAGEVGEADAEIERKVGADAPIVLQIAFPLSLT